MAGLAKWCLWQVSALNIGFAIVSNSPLDKGTCCCLAAVWYRCSISQSEYPVPTQYWCLICEQLPSEKCLWCLVHLTDWWSGLGELQRDKRRNLDTGSTEVGMPPGTSITWSLGFNKSSLVISIPPPSYWDPGAGMYITYDKGIPAKIGLTKISRRTKILVYGKNLTNCFDQFMALPCNARLACSMSFHLSERNSLRKLWSPKNTTILCWTMCLKGWNFFLHILFWNVPIYLLHIGNRLYRQ